uniref:Uncharacterized protein n=1 Tax=Salvator merianae TaxID=96440 RepID=A0A8D0E670_SALMN
MPAKLSCLPFEDKSNNGTKSKKDMIEVDILSPAAMCNIYHISHNAVDCLVFCGFQWLGSSKKKGKK